MEELNFDDIFSDLEASNVRYFEEDRIRAENVASKGNFRRGLESGMDSMQGSLYGAAGIAGDALGIDSVRDWGFEGYQRNQDEAGLNPVDVQNFTDISTDKGLLETASDTAKWFAGTLGQLTPSVAEGLITTLIGAGVGTASAPGVGTVGGALAGMTGRKVVLKAIDEAVESKVKSGIAREIAEREVKEEIISRAKLGGNIGLIEGTAAVEGGGMWGEAAEKHGVENANAGSAFVLGQVSGLSEAYSPGGMLIKRIAGIKDVGSEAGSKLADTFLKRLGTEIPESMSGEAAQEVFQSFLGVLNKKVQDPTVSLTDREAIHEYINSAAAGAAGGLVFGSVNAVFPEKPQAPPPENYTVDDVLNEHAANTSVEAAVARQQIQEAGPIKSPEIEANTVPGILGEKQEDPLTIIPSGDDQFQRIDASQLQPAETAAAGIGQRPAGDDIARLDSHLRDMAKSLYPDKTKGESLPDWVKLRSLKNWEKETGEEVKSYVSSTSAKETLKAVIEGNPLNEKQAKVWAYLKSIAENRAMVDEQAAQGAIVPFDEGTGDFPNDWGETTAEPPASAPPVEEWEEPPSPAPVLSNSERHEIIDNTDSVAYTHEVNTAPSEAQKEAGNYKKAHVKLDGLDISVENPAGSTRSGTDQDGKNWQTEMKADYGYIKGSVGSDKDHVDAFIKPGYKGEGQGPIKGDGNVYVINQQKQDGSFDEHKAVLGAQNENEAIAIYQANYSAGWTGGKSITKMSMAEFKNWVKSDAPKKGELAGKYFAARPVDASDVVTRGRASGETQTENNTLQASAAPASPPSGATSSPAIVEHVDKKTGQVIRGAFLTLKKQEALAVDPQAFKKGKGYFIREEHLSKLNSASLPTTSNKSASKTQLQKEIEKAKGKKKAEEPEVTEVEEKKDPADMIDDDLSAEVEEIMDTPWENDLSDSAVRKVAELRSMRLADLNSEIRKRAKDAVTQRKEPAAADAKTATEDIDSTTVATNDAEFDTHMQAHGQVSDGETIFKLEKLEKGYVVRKGSKHGTNLIGSMDKPFATKEKAIEEAKAWADYVEPEVDEAAGQTNTEGWTQEQGQVQEPEKKGFPSDRLMSAPMARSEEALARETEVKEPNPNRTPGEIEQNLRDGYAALTGEDDIFYSIHENAFARAKMARGIIARIRESMPFVGGMTKKQWELNVKAAAEKQVKNFFEKIDGYNEYFEQIEKGQDNYPHMGKGGLPKNSDPTYKLTVDLVGACVRMLRAMAIHRYIRSTGEKPSSIQMRGIEAALNKHGFDLTCMYCYAFTRRTNAITKLDEMKEHLSTGVVPEDISASSADAVEKIEQLWKKALAEAERKPGWREDMDKLSDLMAIKGPANLKELRKISPDAADFADKYPAIHALKQRVTDAGNMKVPTSDLAVAGQIANMPQSMIKQLSNWGGLRWQSSIDFIPAFTFDYIQGIAEMAWAKVPGHTYTKEIDLVRLFGDCGMKINLSAAPIVRDGKVVWDTERDMPMLDKAIGSISAAEIDEALENLAPEHAGVMMLGVNDEILDWVTRSDSKYAHYCIPWHSSGMPALISAQFKSVLGATDYADPHESMRSYDSSNDIPAKLQSLATKEVAKNGKETGKYLIDYSRIAEVYPELQWVADTYNADLQSYRAKKDVAENATMTAINLPTGLIIDQLNGTTDEEATKLYFELLDKLDMDPQFESYRKRYEEKFGEHHGKYYWRFKKHYARTDTPLAPPNPSKVNFAHAKELDFQWQNSPLATAVRDGSSSIIDAYRDRQLSKEEKEIIDMVTKDILAAGDNPIGSAISSWLPMADRSTQVAGTTRTTKSTKKANAKAEISKQSKAAKALIDSGKVGVTTNDKAEEIIEQYKRRKLKKSAFWVEIDEELGVKYSEDGWIQGFTMPDGRVYLVEENIEEGHAWNVLLHEMGVHARKLMAGTGEFRSILQSVEKRSEEDSATGEAIRRAMDRVPGNTSPKHYWEEVLAYMIEDAPETSLVRRVIALVKKALLKMGITADILNAKDLTALAEITVRAEALKEVNNEQAGRQGRRASDADAIKESRSDNGGDRILGQTHRLSEGQDNSAGQAGKEKSPRPVTPVDLESPAFRRWFGDSQAIDPDTGKPLIFYHGSPTFGEPSGSYTFEENQGKPKSPMAALGHFFTEDQLEAAGYTRGTGNKYAVALRIENPQVIEAWQLPVFSSVEKAQEYVARLKAKGHDGIYLQDAEHAIIFDPNQAKSVEQNTGEFNRANDDIRYSKASPAQTETGPTSYDNLQQTAQAIGRSKKGSITIVPRTRKDSTFLERILSSPEYYFKKVPAAGLMIKAALDRRDLKFEKEQHILGDFVKTIQKLRKKNPKAYQEANDYLIETDETGDGFKIKATDDGWRATQPRSAIKGQYKKGDEIIGDYETEKEAFDAIVEAEAGYLRDEGYHEAAVQAVVQARQLTNRAFDILIADMRRLADEAKENGLPDPFVQQGVKDEAGGFGVYAEGKKQPLALFSTKEEAEQFLAEAAQMISYMVIGGKRGGQQGRNFVSKDKATRYAEKFMGTVEPIKRFANLKVRERTDAELRPLTIRQAMAQMGDLRGTFFPRIRQKGEYVLIAKKKGANPIRMNFDVPMVGDKHPNIQALMEKLQIPIAKKAMELKKQGYEVKIERDKTPTEDVFEATSLVASIDSILEQSLASINKDDVDEVNAAKHVNMLLTMQIADIFKARGFLSTRMGRTPGGDVWKGYEEDMGKALTQYGKSLAAGVAKRETAQAMILAFSGRDYTWQQYKQEVDKPRWVEYSDIVEKRRIHEGEQKNLYHDGRRFMVDVLRNDEQIDRIIGTLKGLAVLKYLGFRVSSAVVNATNMVNAVPATIAGHTGESITKGLLRVTEAAAAYTKYLTVKDSLSKEDGEIFEYISAHGWDEAQFNHEAASELRSKLGNQWNKFMGAAMWGFGAVEKANRAMTIMAAYKAVKTKHPKMDKDEVFALAKEISDRSHGIYGKETQPYWVRGKFNPLRLTFTFQKFTMNYMLNAYDLGFNRKEWKAMSYMLLSPAVLAGAGGTIATPILAGLAGALGIGGDDPEEEFYKWARLTFGSDTLFRTGLSGAMLNINIKGSLEAKSPIPTNFEELAGAPGAIITNVGKAFGHFGKGEVGKGMEALLPTAFGSMFKAVREGTEGITTSNYGSVFYGNDPLKADTLDAALRFMSFNPARISGIREMQWREKKVAQRYLNEKSEIYSKIKRLNLQGEGLTPEILKTIKVYNDRVFHSGRKDITPITASGIREMLKRNSRASKIERIRAA